MKLTTHETEATFKPVTLTITFGSAAEICSLWNRLVVSDSTIKNAMDNSSDADYKPCDKETLYSLWDWADEEYKKLDQKILETLLEDE